MTPRQKEALRFIRAKLKTDGIAPTYEEIAAHFGSRKSKAAALYLVDALVGAGYIRRCPKRPRGLELVETKDHHAPDCPCGVCAHARYLADLKLVQAIQVEPPLALVPKLSGLRALSPLQRVDWKFQDNSRVHRKPLRGVG